MIPAISISGFKQTFKIFNNSFYELRKTKNTTRDSTLNTAEGLNKSIKQIKQ